MPCAPACPKSPRQSRAQPRGPTAPPATPAFSACREPRVPVRLAAMPPVTTKRDCRPPESTIGETYSPLPRVRRILYLRPANIRCPNIFLMSRGHFPRRSQIPNHEVDRMIPGPVVVAAEVERLPGSDLAGTHLMNLISQRQDETAHTIHPCNEHQIGLQFPPDVQVAAIAIMQISLPRF